MSSGDADDLENDPRDDPNAEISPDESAGTDESSEDDDDLHVLVRRLQRLVDPRKTRCKPLKDPLGRRGEASRREEPRVQVTAAVLVAIGLMLSLPVRVANRPRWVLPGLAVLLLIGVFVAKSSRVERRSRLLRIASLSLIGVMSLSNATSAGRLIVDLVRVEGIRNPTQLLLAGGAIWLTNVIVFGLWYWEFDRGGPVERATGHATLSRFRVPADDEPELAPPDWEPGFVDYLYVSFTNALAFSPTDVMPMTRWAKLTMLTQSAISVITVVLVIARAVNILQS